MSNVDELIEAQKLASLSLDPTIPHGSGGEEEEMLTDNPEEFPAGDESIVVYNGEEIPFKVTHYIGELEVQEMDFANGLKWWRDKNGKRRIPSPKNGRPLRAYIPPPEPASVMWLDRDAMALTFNALYAPDGRHEEGWNIGEKIDDTHVKLSLRVNNEHKRFLVQVPNEFQLIGSPLP